MTEKSFVLGPTRTSGIPKNAGLTFWRWLSSNDCKGLLASQPELLSLALISLNVLLWIGFYAKVSPHKTPDTSKTIVKEFCSLELAKLDFFI